MGNTLLTTDIVKAGYTYLHEIDVFHFEVWRLSWLKKLQLKTDVMRKGRVNCKTTCDIID